MHSAFWIQFWNTLLFCVHQSKRSLQTCNQSEQDMGDYISLRNPPFSVQGSEQDLPKSLPTKTLLWAGILMLRHSQYESLKGHNCDLDWHCTQPENMSSSLGITATAVPGVPKWMNEGSTVFTNLNTLFSSFSLTSVFCNWELLFSYQCHYNGSLGFVSVRKYPSACTTQTGCSLNVNPITVSDTFQVLHLDVSLGKSWHRFFPTGSSLTTFSTKSYLEGMLSLVSLHTFLFPHLVPLL